VVAWYWIPVTFVLTSWVAVAVFYLAWAIGMRATNCSLCHRPLDARDADPRCETQSNLILVP
jgi:hypothetical protein